MCKNRYMFHTCRRMNQMPNFFTLSVETNYLVIEYRYWYKVRWLEPTKLWVVYNHVFYVKVHKSYGKPDGTPKSWSIYSIVSILTDPGYDLGHPMIVIMTGQLKNHDRFMFAIIAGSTYNIPIPCYQSLPGQLITWPSHVYNRSRSRCPSYVML